MYFGSQKTLSVAYRQTTINKKGAVMRKSHTSFFEIKFLSKHSHVSHL